MPLMMIMMIIDMMMIITMRIIMMMIVMMIIIMIIIMVIIIIMVGLRLFEGGFDRDVSTNTPIKNGRLKNAGLRATTGGR